MSSDSIEIEVRLGNMRAGRFCPGVDTTTFNAINNRLDANTLTQAQQDDWVTIVDHHFAIDAQSVDVRSVGTVQIADNPMIATALDREMRP